MDLHPSEDCDSKSSLRLVTCTLLLISFNYLDVCKAVNNIAIDHFVEVNKHCYTMNCVKLAF